MNFDDAIAAHIKCKIRLTQLIDGASAGHFQGEVVGREDVCALCQWIQGEGQEYTPSPHYLELVNEHALFHRYAEEAVKKAEMNDHAGARSILSGPCGNASKAIIKTLVALKRKLPQ